MEQNKSVKKNFIYNMLYEVLVIIVPILTAPYISRVLGVNNVGVYNFVTSNVTYFTLIAAVGTLVHAKREIAFHQEDLKQRSDDFYGIFLLRLCSTILAMAIFYVYLKINNNYKVFYWLSSVSIISVVFDISWFFQGIENFKVTVVRNTIIKLLATLLIFLFVKKEADLWIYILINVGSVLLGNISLWFFLPKYIEKFKWKHYQVRKHLYGSLKLFIPVIAIQIYTVLDKTMLGMLTDVLEVSYYSQAEKIIKIGITVINALALVLLPRISALLHSKKYKEAVDCYEKSIDVSLFMAMPMMCGFVLIADDFIPFFLGAGYEGAIPVMKILSILMIVLGLAQIIGTPLLIPLKRENKYTIAVCVGAISNLIMNCFLIPRFAAVGAAVATIISEGLVTGLEIFYIRDTFPVKKIEESFAHYLSAALIMFLVTMIVKYVISPGTVRMFLMIVVGAIAYILILFQMKDAVLMNNFKLVVGKIQNLFRRV